MAELHEPVIMDLPFQVKNQAIKTAPVDASHTHVPPARKWELPASAWKALPHPLADEISREVNEYFLKNWKFPNAKAESTFLKADFPRTVTLAIPTAKYDRILFACRLITLVFLTDGNTHIPLIESSSPSKSGEKDKNKAEKGRKSYGLT